MIEALPLFPLGTVLFPGLVLPLHVFEPRYQQMVADLEALPAGAREFGVVAIRHGHEAGNDFKRGDLYDVGCIAAVRELEHLDEGHVALVVAGGRRFRLKELDCSRPYLRASVEALEERPHPVSNAVAGAVAVGFDTYRKRLSGRAPSLDQLDPDLLSYVVAAAMILQLDEKQALLEAPDAADRLRREWALLRREIAMLTFLPSLPAVDLPRVEANLN